METKTAKFTAALYAALLLFTPLIVVPWASELFEFNKMLFVILTAALVFFTLSFKALRQKKLVLGRTPLDIPLLLLLMSRMAATLFSIDRHTSIWGYYSRFHGGLISTMAYATLYFGFTTWYVSLPNKKSTKQFFLSPLLAAVTLVSLYGFLQHPTPLFRRTDGSWRGLDANQWVQDVEERVFSTLGQPNWLAAWLAMTLPLSWFLLLTTPPDFTRRRLINSARRAAVGAYSLLLFWVLLFTKSRAGLVGLVVGLATFLAILVWKRKVMQLKTAAPLALLIGGYLALTLISGKPLLARFGLKLNPTIIPVKQKSKKPTAPAAPYPAPTPPIPDDTSLIRSIVWRGALNIFAHYPLFGSGPGTFAYSYWRFRPAAHNLTSEWEFLYNKAHNEYLNILATTGLIGFGAYALFVLTYIGRMLKYLRAFSQKSPPAKPGPPPDCLLPAALLSGFIGGLVANFWGFSVVPTALLFFLYPAFSLATTGEIRKTEKSFNLKRLRLPAQIASLAMLLLILFGIGRVFVADLFYARGTRASQTGRSAAAYRSLKLAASLRPNEPVYHDALAFTAAQQAILITDPDQAAQLANEAIAETQKALEEGLVNVNYWKTAAQVFLELAPFDSQLYDQALLTLKQAQDLAPTDPKLPYNLGLVLLQKAVLDDEDFVATAPEGDKEIKSGVTPEEPVQEALEAFKQALKLKADYRDARYALAVTEHELAVDKQGNVRDRERLDQALKQLDIILKTTHPPDYEAGQKRREWSR